MNLLVAQKGEETFLFSDDSCAWMVNRKLGTQVSKDILFQNFMSTTSKPI